MARSSAFAALFTSLLSASAAAQEPAPTGAGSSGARSAPAGTAASAPSSSPGDDGDSGLKALLDQVSTPEQRSKIRGGETGSYGLRLAEYGIAVEVHGYISAEARIDSTGAPPFFDLHHQTLMLTANLFDRMTGEFALEVEHLGEEFYPPFAFMDFLAVKDLLTIRAGFFPVPIGAYNENLYPDFSHAPINAPLILRQIVPAGWSDVGAQVRGKFQLVGALALNYAMYAVNGLEQKDHDANDGVVDDAGDIREMRFNATDSNHWDKGLGGRLGLSWVDLSVGMSGYSGAYTIDGRRRLSLVDVDATYDASGFEVRAEAVVALQETAARLLTKWGAYAFAGYFLFENFEPFVQLDLADLGGGRSWRGLAGLAYHVFPRLAWGNMVKLEFSAKVNELTGETESVGMAQAVVAF